jgi:hypothetical protein
MESAPAGEGTGRRPTRFGGNSSLVSTGPGGSSGREAQAPIGGEPGGGPLRLREVAGAGLPEVVEGTARYFARPKLCISRANRLIAVLGRTALAASRRVPS